MGEGWVCAICGRSYSPIVLECARCNRAQNIESERLDRQGDLLSNNNNLGHSCPEEVYDNEPFTPPALTPKDPFSRPVLWSWESDKE